VNEPVSVAALKQLLEDPRWSEQLAGLPLVVVRLDTEADVRALGEEPLRSQLSRLRAVQAGIGACAGESDLDIDLDGAGDMARVADGVARAPMAAVSLVELLRMGLWEAGRSTASGLTAESLTYSMLQAGPEFAAWLAERGKVEVPPDPGPAVRAGRSGNSMWVELNRPHRANAVSVSLRDALTEALEVPLLDKTVETIELRGAGASFCSGGDLGEFGSFDDVASAHHTRLVRSPARLLDALAGRVTARIHGACAGAGIELPAFAHRVAASNDANIWLPELGLGLIPGAGGTVSLPRRIGPKRTAWLALTGAHLNATTALEWGLVDEIVDDSPG
jgi:hypothetical protein